MRIGVLTAETTGLNAEIVMTSAPGQARELPVDLDELSKVHHVSFFVSLVSDAELDYLGLHAFVEFARVRGIEVRLFPIGDFSTPDSISAFALLIDEIISTARSGRAVAIHCWAGRGRTGLVAACTLVAAGFDAPRAIETVRRCRPGAVE